MSAKKKGKTSHRRTWRSSALDAVTRWILGLATRLGKKVLKDWFECAPTSVHTRSRQPPRRPITGDAGRTLPSTLTHRAPDHLLGDGPSNRSYTPAGRKPPIFPADSRAVSAPPPRFRRRSCAETGRCLGRRNRCRAAAAPDRRRHVLAVDLDAAVSRLDEAIDHL